MQLSPHFTLEELTVSQTAARNHLDNSPGQRERANLAHLAASLEQVRTLLGHPLIISSGYRSPKVNTLVGSSSKSAHVQGYAADFICPGFGTPLQVAEAIAASGIGFDQVIHEYGRWCHLSVAPAQRRETLTIDDHGTRAGLHAI